MKAPAFWHRPRGPLAYSLTPAGLLFRAGAALRRLRAKPYQSSLPVICVGNIVAGGSGKTPMALALAHMLQQEGHRPVFVTRGYGGREKGPLLVDRAAHGAADVGDEALLLSYTAPVWIGHDRAAAIREAENNATHIILDDGLQNPNLRPDLSFLVIDDESGLGNGLIMPAGPLREPLSDALRRAAAVVLIGEKSRHVAMLTAAGVPPGKIIHAYLEPDLPLGFPRDRPYYAFAGIGRPQKFYQTCRALGLTLAGMRDFADHHVFTPGELNQLKQSADRAAAQLLTTEKDWVRLPPGFREHAISLRVALAFQQPGMVKKLLDEVSQKPAFR